MKAIKISDKSHAELTSLVGQLTAESGQIKTYENAIEALLHRSIVLPPKFLLEVENFLETNKQFGYISKEEFVREAVRWFIDNLNRRHKGDSMVEQLHDDRTQTSGALNSSSQDSFETNQAQSKKL
jgi:hypothetical protein